MIFPKNYHRKNIFLWIIAIIISVIFILSLSTYYYFKNISLDSSNNYIKDSLSQVSSSANMMNSLGNSLSLQIMNERDIIPILSQTLPSANQLSAALMRLDAYSAMNPQIHSLYIYNGYTDTLYTNLPSEVLKSKNTFFDQDIVNILQHLENYDTSLPIPRSIVNPTNTFTSNSISSVYTFIHSNTTIYNNEEVLTAVIVNLSEEYLQELIASMSNNNPYIFIVDKEGTLMSGVGQYPMLSNLSTHPAIQPVIRSPINFGYFLQTINDIPSIVTYIRLSTPDNWYFIQLTPYEHVTSNLFNIRNHTLILGIALLIIGGIYTFIISKKISSPISKLDDALSNFKKQSKENTTELRYYFLNSLLSSYEIIDRSSLEKKFTTYKICLDPHTPYKMILLEPKALDTPPSISPTTEAQLLSIAVINIAEEIGHETFNCTCIPLSYSRIICLLNIDDNESPEDTLLQIENYIYVLTDRCEKLLNISFAATVSSLGEDLSLLSNLYQDVLDSSLYHHMYQNESLIFQEFIKNVESKPFTYPHELHQSLLDNLKLGNLTEVVNIYQQLIDYSCNYSYTAFMSTLLHLTYSIDLTISNLNHEESLMIKYDQSNFISLIKNAENLNLINTCFIHLFKQICEDINCLKRQQKEKNYDDLVQDIYQLIDARYANPDTCIQSIADHLNLSAAYLGRLFTKLTSKSITQCISDKRLDVACHLLSYTDHSMAQISELCGFNSINYFYKVFKKAYGITPSNYRKMKVPQKRECHKTS